LRKTGSHFFAACAGTTTSKGGVTLVQNGYTRDLLGRISHIASTVPGNNWYYVYDRLGQLVEARDTFDNSLTQSFAGACPRT
jgi:YD repeat-containing protein